MTVRGVSPVKVSSPKLAASPSPGTRRANGSQVARLIAWAKIAVEDRGEHELAKLSRGDLAFCEFVQLVEHEIPEPAKLVLGTSEHALGKRRVIPESASEGASNCGGLHVNRTAPGAGGERSCSGSVGQEEPYGGASERCNHSEPCEGLKPARCHQFAVARYGPRCHHSADRDNREGYG